MKKLLFLLSTISISAFAADHAALFKTGVYSGSGHVRTEDGMYGIEGPLGEGWFMDRLHKGDQVLFAAKCDKHNICTFWLPNPDKPGKEFETQGVYRPNNAQPDYANTKVDVKIINRQDSDSAYTFSTSYYHNAAAANFHVTGATLTLQLPDGRTAVVNCEYKFAEHMAGPIGNRRSCRVPLVDTIQAEFHGNAAKLFWPVSLDGKKTASETYKILAVQ